MTDRNGTPDVFIVEPRLWTLRGHELDHVIEFARAAKAQAPGRRVVVLTPPPDEALAGRLRQTKTIDLTVPCFKHRRYVEDDGGPFDILKKSVEDAASLRAAVHRHRSGRRVTLFFTTFGLHAMLMVAFLRLTSPWLRVRTIGILRKNPVTIAGQFSRKYTLFSQSVLARPFWKLATGRTLAFTDSHILQRVQRERLGLETALVPVLTPGVWDLPPDGDGPASRSGGPVTVGFIGEPGAGRGFDLFVLTALAMEQERRSGQVEFLAVMLPGYEVTPDAVHCVDALRQGLPGMRLELRWMPTPADFVAQMKRADILWNVYAPWVFHQGTSGRLVHGMCLGKKIVCSRWEWAVEAVRPCSMVRFVDERLEQTVAAVRALLASEVDEASRQEVRRWRQTYSREAWDRFVTDALERSDDDLG
ncbi:MAG: hypothetical protein HZA91_15070 [Verrucomicrobia bacterium]|nr:hypothetical protein [Verrucomicrobiota bacterium]